MIVLFFGGRLSHFIEILLRWQSGYQGQNVVAEAIKFALGHLIQRLATVSKAEKLKSTDAHDYDPPILKLAPVEWTCIISSLGERMDYSSTIHTTILSQIAHEGPLFVG